MVVFDEVRWLTEDGLKDYSGPKLTWKVVLDGDSLEESCWG